MDRFHEGAGILSEIVQNQEFVGQGINGYVIDRLERLQETKNLRANVNLVPHGRVERVEENHGDASRVLPGEIKTIRENVLGKSKPGTDSGSGGGRKHGDALGLALVGERKVRTSQAADGPAFCVLNDNTDLHETGCRANDIGVLRRRAACGRNRLRRKQGREEKHKPQEQGRAGHGLPPVEGRKKFNAAGK